MHTRTLLAAVATAAIAAIVTPSLSSAQDTTKTKTTSKGEVATAPNFGSLISAINSASMHNSKLATMTTLNASDVQLVNAGDLVKGDDAKALENALTKNQPAIDALRATLGANTTISGALTASEAKVTPADVIAADVGADGKVVLYYWKKP